MKWRSFCGTKTEGKIKAYLVHGGEEKNLRKKGDVGTIGINGGEGRKRREGYWLEKWTNEEG